MLKNQLTMNPRVFGTLLENTVHLILFPKLFYNNTAGQDEHSANLYFSFFNSVYMPKRTNCDISNINILEYDLPHNCFFSVDVFDYLTSLHNTKSIGSDGLFGLFLFNVRHSISFPLWLLFRRSLNDGNFPDMETVFCYTGTEIGGCISSLQLQVNLYSFPHCQIIQIYSS